MPTGADSASVASIHVLRVSHVAHLFENPSKDCLNPSANSNLHLFVTLKCLALFCRELDFLMAFADRLKMHSFLKVHFNKFLKK